MRLILRALAVLLLVWAVVLLGLRGYVLAAGDITPLTGFLANGWGLSNLVLVILFWQASSDPPRHLGAIVAALATVALKTANDVYGVLLLPPPPQAFACLADLVLSVAILVGILRELPRTLAQRKAGMSSK